MQSPNEDFDVAVERAKLDAVKELAYGASHEINNPLANIVARSQTLLRDEADPERRRALAAIHAQAMRAHEMISDLMLFARPPRLETATLDIVALVDRSVRESAEEASERRIQVDARLPNEPIPCDGDATQLAVAIRALLQNSLEAVGCDGLIRVTCQNGRTDDRDRIEIEVADDGPGISPEIGRHIFDPFFSGREAGRGLGFGLSKCWRIVTEHGGEVIAGNQPGQGACMTIRLPSQRPAP